MAPVFRAGSIGWFPAEMDICGWRMEIFMENSETNFVRIIKEICRENQITVRSFGGDWGFLLEKDGRRGFIIGYQFGLNAAVSKDICTDKSIASEIMEQDGVPCVKHICFMAPHMFQLWEEMETGRS